MSDGFAAVAKTGDLEPGAIKWVAVDRERVVLANVNGEFYALRDVCGHKNAPLSRGRLIGHLIECPLHFAQFDIRTGKLVDGPISNDIPVYDVRIDGDTIYARPATKS
jgi:3-phenylpropionate/trans-cinnamate dioxygenase ferredoxin component